MVNETRGAERHSCASSVQKVHELPLRRGRLPVPQEHDLAPPVEARANDPGRGDVGVDPIQTLRLVLGLADQDGDRVAVDARAE